MNVMGGEYGAELEDLALRRKYAEMLRAQALQPPQSAGMAGRTVAPIHWTQALAGALKGVSGDMESGNISRERKALGKRYESESQDRLQKALAMAKGIPGTSESIMDETAAGGAGQMAQIQTPGTPGDLMGAATMLAGSPNQMQQQLGYGALSQQFAPKTAPKTVDLGDKIGLLDNRGQIVGYLPKAASPDATMRERGAEQRHLAPSGSAILQNQGAMQRHQTPSGSAILGERGAMARHGSPSGSALLADTRAREKNALDAQTVRLKQEELTNKLQQQGVAKAGVVAAYQIAGETLDRLKEHPGLGEAVGVGWEKTAIPFVGPVIPGTDRANFVAELEAFKSQVFLPMVQNLRGMGALSDAEGKKLTAAVGALETNMDEKAFLASIENIKKDLAAAQTRVLSPQRRSTDRQGAMPSQDAIDAELRRRGGG